MLTEKDENKLVAIAAGVIFILLALCLMSCATKKKVVTEKEYVHDTLIISRVDTFQVERWNYKHDTIRIESERIVTLQQQDKSLPAETIRVESNNWHYEREVVRDSSSTLVSRIDSILRAMDMRHESEKLTVKTEPPWFQRIIFLLIIGLVVYIIVKWK